MKKLLATLVCGALAFVCTAQPVNAAAALNESELELLALVENGISIGDGYISYDPGSDEYVALSDYLELPDVNIDAAALATVKASVKDAQGFLTTYGDEVVTTELVTQLFGLLVPAAEALNLNMTYNPLTDGLTLTDNNGNILFEQENIFDLATDGDETGGGKLEDTGENFTSTYAIVGSLVVMLACAGYMTLKKKDALN